MGVAALAAGLLAFASQAEAALIVAIDNLATAGADVVAQDQFGTGAPTPFGFTNVVDFVPTPDILASSAFIPGSFSSSFTAFSLSPSTLSLTVSITNLGVPTAFVIALTDTDFLATGQNVLTGILTSTVTGTGAVTGTGFVDPLNQPFGFGGVNLASVDFGPFGPGTSGTTDTSDPFSPLMVPFSLNQFVTMNLGTGAAATVSFMMQAITQQVTEVIEPGTFSLIALAVIALGVMRARFGRLRRIKAIVDHGGLTT
jgi:hypothetical protein